MNKDVMDGTIPMNDDAKRRDKQPTTEEDEWRCDTVAQLLLEGKKGEELAQAMIRNLYHEREIHREMKMRYLGFNGASRRNSYDMELGYDSWVSNAFRYAFSTVHMPMYVPRRISTE